MTSLKRVFTSWRSSSKVYCTSESSSFFYYFFFSFCCLTKSLTSSLLSRTMVIIYSKLYLILVVVCRYSSISLGLRNEMSGVRLRGPSGSSSTFLEMASLSLLNIFFEQSEIYMKLFETIDRIDINDHPHVNSIKREVILSQPISSLVYLATKKSSKFLRIMLPVFPVFLSLLILVTIG